MTDGISAGPPWETAWPPAAGAGGEDPHIVVRDRRRIDPETGAVRDEAGFGGQAEPGGQEARPSERGTQAAPATEGRADATPGNGSAELAELQARLDERTNDLQRLGAEYANYRRRVDRDRAVAGELATANVLTALLPVLDDLDRARAHGDLTGPFATVADHLVGALDKHGLQAFGEKGDAFDPTCHEAVMHSTSPDVLEPTCVDVFRRGYWLGEKLLRAAMVAVAESDGSAVPPVPHDAEAGEVVSYDVSGDAPAGSPAADEQDSADN